MSLSMAYTKWKPFARDFLLQIKIHRDAGCLHDVFSFRNIHVIEITITRPLFACLSFHISFIDVFEHCRGS